MLAVHPSSGPAGDTAPLVEAAERAGVSVVVLDPDGDIAEELTRALPDDLAELGMAGGDGTLSLAAAICIDRDIPLVCVPFGTRNHFAHDLGLDRRDPCVAIEAFADGVERRVDVGDLSGPTLSEQCHLRRLRRSDPRRGLPRIEDRHDLEGSKDQAKGRKCIQPIPGGRTRRLRIRYAVFRRDRQQLL